MTATIIDGNAIASKINQDIKTVIEDKKLSPTMHIILANDLDASKIYVRRKMKACEEVGITPILHKIDDNASTQDIVKLIEMLNADQNAHGIFLQLPVRAGLDSNQIIQSIDPKKDVDGLTTTNMGKLISGDDTGLVACTPQGVMKLLEYENIDLSGKHAVIIGRSLLFGKPMGQLLLQANCTVTQCHSKTIDLPSMTSQADILIAAVGQPKMVKADCVKDGAIVIDVGINKMDDGKISGDVDFDEVSKIASAITPVPGGVGPMTVACLLRNTVKACENRNKI